MLYLPVSHFHVFFLPLILWIFTALYVQECVATCIHVFIYTYEPFDHATQSHPGSS